MHGSHCYSTDGVLTCGWPDAHGGALVRDVSPVDMVATTDQHDAWTDTRLTDWSDVDRTPRADWSDHRRYEADWS